MLLNRLGPFRATGLNGCYRHQSNFGLLQLSSAHQRSPAAHAAVVGDHAVASDEAEARRAQPGTEMGESRAMMMDEDILQRHTRFPFILLFLFR
jgi:hypothetical protein